MYRTLALLTLLAAPVAAQSIDTINGLAIPLANEGDIVVSSIGTELILTGSGFGGTTGLSKPKVFINSVLLPKKRGLKVISATDTELVVAIKSGLTGDYDLTVQPKGKDLLPLVAQDVVRLVPPVFEQPNPVSAAPEALITLTGSFGPETFGTKLGKVRVNGKKALVTSWTADEIVFTMPAKLANGLYVVEVTNKLGKATVVETVEGAPYCLQVDGSDFDVGGPDRFSCKVDKKKYQADSDGFLTILGFYETDPIPRLTISATLKSGFPHVAMTVVVPVDLETATFPLLVQGSEDGSVELSQTDALFAVPTVWSTDFDGEGADDWLVVLQSYEPNAETGGTQLAGNFVASLQLTSEEGTPATHEVSLGDFRITVDPEGP